MVELVITAQQSQKGVWTCIGEQAIDGFDVGGYSQNTGLSAVLNPCVVDD